MRANQNQKKIPWIRVIGFRPEASRKYLDVSLRTVDVTTAVGVTCVTRQIAGTVMTVNEFAVIERGRSGRRLDCRWWLGWRSCRTYYCYDLCGCCRCVCYLSKKIQNTVKQKKNLFHFSFTLTHSTECVTDLDLQNEMNIFESLLITIKASIIFWGIWGSSAQKTLPP